MWTWINWRAAVASSVVHALALTLIALMPAVSVGARELPDQPLIGGGLAPTQEGLHGIDLLPASVIVQSTATSILIDLVSKEPLLVHIRDCPSELPLDREAILRSPQFRKASTPFVPSKVILRFSPLIVDPEYAILCGRISASGEFLDAYPTIELGASRNRELLRAIRQMRFEAAERNGRPVSAWHRL